MKFGKKFLMVVLAGILVFAGVSALFRKDVATETRETEDVMVTAERGREDGFSDTSFDGEVSDTEIVGSGFRAGMFEDSLLDNTWLFGGGSETEGRFAEIGSARNYIGCFEEYVRWDQRVDSTLYGLQRYVINAGAAGQDATVFAGKLSSLIARTKPKAVSYMIGVEDYSKGAEGMDAFLENIKSILNQSLAMNEGQGYAVLQLPHAVQDADTNEEIRLYANAAREAFEAVYNADAECAERMALVDHWSRTKDDAAFKNALTAEGLLAADGQEEIARQFSAAVFGSAKSDSYRTSGWTVERAPEQYLDAMPDVTALEDGLEVTMPDAAGNGEWKYILDIDGVEIMGTAAGDFFVIDALPSGSEYRLIVQTEDGRVQYAPVSGVIRAGERAFAPEPEGAIPKAIRQKVENKEEPLTWLFMGDSITHGAAQTKGYDSMVQLFEKYVKEDLGRTDDLVINTAVSGARATRTLQNMQQRVLKYQPDIVSIMLGTNDAVSIPEDPNSNADFQKNLKEIVKQIREVKEDVILIFRSPTPGKDGSQWKAGSEGENGTVERMKEVAKEDGNILFIDQFTEWNEEGNAYSYLYDTSHYFYDDVHLSAAGHVWMTTKFIRECGLDTNTRIASLAYRFSYAETNSSIVPDVSKADGEDAVTVSKQALQAKYGADGTIGDIRVTMTGANGRTYTKQGTLREDTVTIGGLPGGEYTVKVVANIMGDTPQKVVFADEKITLEPTVDSEK